MAHHDAVFVGFTTLDISGRPVADVPEGGGIAFVEEMRMNPAGTAAGALMNAAKLGVQCAGVYCVGDDAMGRFITDTYKGMNIDVSLAQTSSSRQTSSTMLPIRPNGDRPALHCRGASDDLFVPDDMFDVVCDAKILHHGGTGFIKAMEGGQSAKLLKHAKYKGLVVTFDLIGPNENTLTELKSVLPFVDYFMPSMEEATYMSGIEEPAKVAEFFMDLGAGACVFKCGARGSFIKTAEKEFQLPAYKIEVSDTTGCGDSYCGGFIAGLNLGYSLEEACQLGTATSALVATGLGSDAAVIDLQTTEKFMRSTELRS